MNGSRTCSPWRQESQQSGGLVLYKEREWGYNNTWALNQITRRSVRNWEG